MYNKNWIGNTIISLINNRVVAFSQDYHASQGVSLAEITKLDLQAQMINDLLQVELQGIGEDSVRAYKKQLLEQQINLDTNLDQLLNSLQLSQYDQALVRHYLSLHGLAISASGTDYVINNQTFISPCVARDAYSKAILWPYLCAASLRELKASYSTPNLSTENKLRGFIVQDIQAKRYICKPVAEQLSNVTITFKQNTSGTVTSTIDIVAATLGDDENNKNLYRQLALDQVNDMLTLQSNRKQNINFAGNFPAEYLAYLVFNCELQGVKYDTTNALAKLGIDYKDFAASYLSADNRDAYEDWRKEFAMSPNMRHLMPPAQVKTLLRLTQAHEMLKTVQATVTTANFLANESVLEQAIKHLTIAERNCAQMYAGKMKMQLQQQITELVASITKLNNESQIVAEVEALTAQVKESVAGVFQDIYKIVIDPENMQDEGNKLAELLTNNLGTVTDNQAKLAKIEALLATLTEYHDLNKQLQNSTNELTGELESLTVILSEKQQEIAEILPKNILHCATIA